jgi:hypothetical protein
MRLGKWIIDAQTILSSASGVRRLASHESLAPNEAHWNDKTLHHRKKISPLSKRSLRGSKDITRRQLQDGLVDAFRLKMYRQEVYCVSDTG